MEARNKSSAHSPNVSLAVPNMETKYGISVTKNCNENPTIQEIIIRGLESGFIARMEVSVSRIPTA